MGDLLVCSMIGILFNMILNSEHNGKNGIMFNVVKLMIKSESKMKYSFLCNE